MLQDFERVRYQNTPIVEVICQLRFPTILSIGTKEPAEFQDMIRKTFPRYSKKMTKQPPKVMNGPGGVKVEQQPDEVNYHFISADNQWKVNLTTGFIAVSTTAYTTWEEFAGKLDEALVCFIKVYEPAFFERIGFRYINAISRKELGVEDCSFSDLIQPAYLGLMAEEDVNERAFVSAAQNVLVKLPGGCSLKLHCGPGMIKRDNIPDNETKFIMDIDVFMEGNVEMKHSAGALNTVHINANRVFRNAITKTLHNAMEPI